MGCYISFLDECKDYLDEISSLRATDTLILLYSSDNDMVSIKVAEKLFKSKYNVVYSPIESNDENILSFTLGKLAIQYKDIKCLTKSVLVNSLLNTSDVKAPVKRARKASSATENVPLKAVNNSKNSPITPPKSEKAKTSTKTTKKAVNEAKNDVKLKNPMDLIPLLKKQNTDEFQVSKYALEIYNCYIKAFTEKKNVAECFKEKFGDNTETLMNTIRPIKQELFDAVTSIAKVKKDL